MNFLKHFKCIGVGHLLHPKTLLGLRGTRNQGAVLFFVLTILSSCSTVEKATNAIFPETPSSVLFATVVADEPTAVLAARDVLAKGGTAADAAVTLYFTLAVTLPSQAGLGSGGLCLVHNPFSGGVEVLDFSSVAGGYTGVTNSPIAVPTAARGMAWLHARFGRLAWANLLAQAATTAREGATTSRAFINDLKASASDLANDSVALSLFFNRIGDPIGEGVILQQIELGSVLGQIGARGVGVMYRGALATRVADAAVSKKQFVDSVAFSTRKPKWLRPIGLPLGDRTVYFSPEGAGKIAAAMWKSLSGRTGLKGADMVAQTLKLARAAKVAYGPRSGTEAPQSGSGFSVVDGTGLAVVCSVTSNEDFGTGRFLPGLGFALAPVPGHGVSARQPLTPILVVDSKTKKFVFAATGGGGTIGATSTVAVTARTLLGGMPLRAASDRPRVHQGGYTDDVVAEKSLTVKEINALKAGGAKVKLVPRIGRVNAVYCEAGLPPGSKDDTPCQVISDKRGHGVGAQFKKDRSEQR